MNKVTGKGVSVNQEEMKGYFNQLDLKKDGVIDFEEYSDALAQKEGLLESFNYLNQGVTDRLNIAKAEEYKKVDINYMKKLATIENEIKLLVQHLEEQTGSINSLAAPINHHEISLTFRKSDRHLSSSHFEIPDSEDRNRRQRFSTFKASKEFQARFDPKVEIIKDKLTKLLENLEIVKEKGSFDHEEDQNSGELRRT